MRELIKRGLVLISMLFSVPTSLGIAQEAPQPLLASVKKIPAPRVTRSNFVSIRMKTWSNILPLGSSQGDTEMLISGNMASIETVLLRDKNPSIPIKRSTGLSEGQLEALLKEINAVQFASLGGEEYGPKNSGENKGEYVVLTISDKNNKDHSYTVISRNADTPLPYQRITNYLRRIFQEKFQVSALPLNQMRGLPTRSAQFNDQNFVWLELKQWKSRDGYNSGHLNLKIFTPRVHPSYENRLMVSGLDKGSLIRNLSPEEFQTLIDLLNEVKVAELAGVYRRNNLAEGIAEQLEIAIRSEEDRWFTFSVFDYGHVAPINYYKLRDFLLELAGPRKSKKQDGQIPPNPFGP